MQTSNSLLAANRRLKMLVLCLSLGCAAGAAAALRVPHAPDAAVAAVDVGVPGVWLAGRSSVPAASDVVFAEGETPAAPTF